ncbi:hypothetical protein [Dysgonomonas sp. Marseille-P4361]|uniref:hypothetical protein n=1 Tax=Dysgonomonas sp. Marseille-P4361 TaxID=2161820 RepID=UPI000D55D4DB|nr:hypothetical protein [Dysgonomonas sp. Marseille-P4361]
MTTKTNNPHAWLFAYMRNIQGNEDRDEVRKALVFDYSNGKTDSLVELYAKYPRAYQQMRRDLSQKKRADDPNLDKARKRLIAAIFSNLERRKYKPDTDYVKRVACKAANVNRFNDIDLMTLKALYRRFGEKNAATHNAWADALLESIADS